MHELSIAAAVVESAEEAAREHGASAADAVESVRLRVGELAGVVADALQFSFEVVREGTMLASAQLLVEEVPARARCASCTEAFPVGVPPRLDCPRCGRFATGLVSGGELELAEVVLADGAAAGACGARQAGGV